MRDATTSANPMLCGVRSCEIGCHVKLSPFGTLTKIWPTLWVSTLCPVVSVSTFA